eukprot:111288-Pelagomonas_calceolata.AAC.3
MMLPASHFGLVAAVSDCVALAFLMVPREQELWVGVGVVELLAGLKPDASGHQKLLLLYRSCACPCGARPGA